MPRRVVGAAMLALPLGYPYLVECFCNTTVTSQVSVVTTASSEQTQSAVLALPSCINDVFATTGIRWYVNGPFDPSITYWPTTTVNYNGDRAAIRLIRLGYRCQKTQLVDSTKLGA
uniref:Secreted protein n=1 Tax=Achlya hypogyna TaxID=1202772 RepID=A0A0A7CP79_ACHHY|nr:secreted protein [Achlya hypogyna]